MIFVSFLPFVFSLIVAVVWLFFGAYFVQAYLLCGVIYAVAVLLVPFDGVNMGKAFQSASVGVLVDIGRAKAGRLRMTAFKIAHAVRSILTWPEGVLYGVAGVVASVRAQGNPMGAFTVEPLVPTFLMVFFVGDIAAYALLSYSRGPVTLYLAQTAHWLVLIGLAAMLVRDMIRSEFAVSVRTNLTPPVVNFVIITISGVVAALLVLATLRILDKAAPGAAFAAVFTPLDAVDLLFFSGLTDFASPVIHALIHDPQHSVVNAIRSPTTPEIVQTALGAALYAIAGRWVFSIKDMRRTPREALGLTSICVLLRWPLAAQRFLRGIPADTVEYAQGALVIAAADGDEAAVRRYSDDILRLRLVRDPNDDWRFFIVTSILNVLPDSDRCASLILNLLVKTRNRSANLLLLAVLVFSEAQRRSTTLTGRIDADERLAGDKNLTETVLEVLTSGDREGNRAKIAAIPDPASAVDTAALIKARLLYLGVAITAGWDDVQVEQIHAVDDALLRLRKEIGEDIDAYDALYVLMMLQDARDMLKDRATTLLPLADTLSATLAQRSPVAARVLDAIKDVRRVRGLG